MHISVGASGTCTEHSQVEFVCKYMYYSFWLHPIKAQSFISTLGPLVLDSVVHTTYTTLYCYHVMQIRNY